MSVEDKGEGEKEQKGKIGKAFKPHDTGLTSMTGEREGRKGLILQFQSEKITFKLMENLEKIMCYWSSVTHRNILALLLLLCSLIGQ
jgi:hypothetical protein